MKMISEQDIISFMQQYGKPVTASELAKALDVTKPEVNSLLYAMEGSRLNRTGTMPPYWSMMPIEKQIVARLSEYPITAAEIAEDLRVSKSIVNSILYRLEGTVTYRDDEARPNWFLSQY